MINWCGMVGPEEMGVRGAGHFGGRLTMQDVADAAGVSRTLVSLILSGKPGAKEATRDRVLRIANELGYRPDSAARNLARSNRRVIGVLASMHNLFHAELVDTIFASADALGYDILLSAVTANRDERRAADVLLGHRCDAMILLGANIDPTDIRQLGSQAAVVVVGGQFGASNVSSVHAAEASGVRQIIDHLAELGHRDIIHIDGGAKTSSKERREAYRDAMRHHSLDEWIRVLPGDFTEISGAQAADTLLRQGAAPMPTAVFAGNDRCAVGLLDALRRNGVQSPDDVSVVGYDDTYLAQLAHIDLTTVNQNPVQQAELAVREVISKINSPQLDHNDYAVEPKLVIRGTTGHPRRP